MRRPESHPMARLPPVSDRHTMTLKHCSSLMPPPPATVGAMYTKPMRTVCATACRINPSAGAGLRTVPPRQRAHQPAATLSNPETLWPSVTERRFFGPGTHGKRPPSPNGVFRTGHSWQAVPVTLRWFRNMPRPHGELRSAPAHSMINGSPDRSNRSNYKHNKELAQRIR